MEFSRLFLSFGIVLALHAPVWARAGADPIREPRPFAQPYRDGFVFVLWDPTVSDERIVLMLKRIQDTGAQVIELPVWGCQSSLTSNDVGSCEVFSREFTRRIARHAVAMGLSVVLLPIVGTSKWEWRGYFEPSDVDAWFKSYTEWMEGVAMDALALGSPELIVGSEFKSLYKETSHWRAFLQHMRGFFPGPLVVTANWDTMDFGFWDEADAIGVSAYFPLSVIPNPPQEALDRAWVGHREKLRKLAEKWKRPLHITEVGYTSTATAAATPWHTPPNDVPDAALQARCFEAFRKAWTGERWLVRANAWAVGDPLTAAFERSADPLGKPAEEPLRAFIRDRTWLMGF